MKEPQGSGIEPKAISRRALLQSASAVAVAGMMGGRSFAESTNASSDKSKAFPDKFLWGCATAGHQVEGNNTSSDLWLIEHLPESVFKEPSGDACDHYHLYPQDISMLADLGFNTYRFSLEWARIEPEEGFFSRAELEHYRRVLAVCHEHHLTPLLTYSHFSVPRWFAWKGGWENPAAPDLYARFCEKATRHLGDLVGYASTFNEPDIPQLLSWLNLPGMGPNLTEMLQNGLVKVRKQLNAPQFASFFLGDGKKIRDGLLAAHQKGRTAMKSVRSDMPVGFNLAMSDDQAGARGQSCGRKACRCLRPLAGSRQTMRLPRGADLFAIDCGEEGFASAEGRRVDLRRLGVLSGVRGARGALCQQGNRRAHYGDGERSLHQR